MLSNSCVFSFNNKQLTMAITMFLLPITVNHHSSYITCPRQIDPCLSELKAQALSQNTKL